MRLVCAILSFLAVLSLTAPPALAETADKGIRASQLRCFIQHYDAYHTLAQATRFVVVDFAICPILPDGDDILQAVLAAMGSDMSNSLGTVTFAGEGLNSQFRVFTLAEAACVRDWAYELTSQDDELVSLRESSCFDE